MIPVKEFFVAGRAVFTIEVPLEFQKNFRTNSHYTYKILRKEAKNGFPESYFVYLLSGPDNIKNYSYVGKFNPDSGRLLLTEKSKVSDDCWSVRLFRRCMARVFEERSDIIEQSGFNVHHEGMCGKCGRKLTVPESIRSGLGPICSK